MKSLWFSLLKIANLKNYASAAGGASDKKAMGSESEKNDPEDLQKVCLMGEGLLVGSPTEDTGLRAAWSR